MTYNSHFTILFFFLLISTTISQAQNGLLLPLKRDPKTSQFYTTFQMGSRRTTITAVVHLGGQHLWFACDNYYSATYAPLSCDSPTCDAVGIGCLGCNRPARPGCANNTCGAAPGNPFAGYFTSDGFFVDSFSTGKHVRLPDLLFSCVPDEYLGGLAASATGMLGLSRSDIAFHKQVAEKIKLPDRFSLCPPSSGVGRLSIGGGISKKSKISDLLKSTPLIVNKPTTNRPYSVPDDLSEEYFIDVKSIRVAGAPLNLKDSYFAIDGNRAGGTKISSLQNYTAMHTTIYKPLVRAFDKAASDMKMKNAAAVAPFRTCYRSETVKRTAAGPDVPAIDLVFAGKGVYWRISGANSMVEIDGKTMCLAFVDAGSRPETSIVIGAHQMVENFLEFDLVSSRLEFSSSLLVHNKSCSGLNFMRPSTRPPLNLNNSCFLTIV